MTGIGGRYGLRIIRMPGVRTSFTLVFVGGVLGEMTHSAISNALLFSSTVLLKNIICC